MRVPTPLAVRRTELGDIRCLANTLAEAFDGYVWTDWAFPADDRRERLRVSFELFLGATVNGLGQVWATEDGHCVAVWVAPGPPTLSDSDAAALGEAYRSLLGDNAGRVETAEQAIAALRPPQPYWYLATMGTRPAHRRQGLARAVLGPVLRHCHETVTPAVLETSASDNLRLYGTLGFKAVAALDPPGAAPHVWIMVRPAPAR